MVVITAGGHEEDVAGRAPAGHIARLHHDVEAEDVDVEAAHAVDVGGAQVDVADRRAGLDGPRRPLPRDDRALEVLVLGCARHARGGYALASAPGGVALHPARVRARAQRPVRGARNRAQAADRPRLADLDVVAAGAQVADGLGARAVLD